MTSSWRHAKCFVLFATHVLLFAGALYMPSSPSRIVSKTTIASSTSSSTAAVFAKVLIGIYCANESLSLGQVRNFIIHSRFLLFLEHLLTKRFRGAWLYRL